VLFQQALRVGKRSHAETDIDRAAPSLVTAAIERIPGSVAGRRIVVVGAGAMASLAISTCARLGASDIAVVNRTSSKAHRLAREYAARPLPFSELASALRNADVVVSCTGAVGVLITRDALASAREGVSDPLAIIDLALPHDVDPSVQELPGISLVGLATLAEELRASESAIEVEGVRVIVAEEISAFLSARRQSSVTPTVVALRSMATGVVEAEMERLAIRLPDLDPATRAEVLHTVRRVADKLLHEPTVRVKELANENGAVSYATALAELFALDPDAVDAVTRAAVVEDGRP
jgi:glutamyl-tRNA reductase